jgi:GAF domain-containing protein
VARNSDTTFGERISIAGIRSRVWLGPLLRALLRPGSWIIGAVAAAYAVRQILKDQEVPSKEAWAAGHPLSRLLLIFGVTALVGTFLVFTGYGRILRKADQNDELYEACRGLWHLVVESLQIDMTKVGVHLWTVKGLKGFRYLEKRATFIIETRRSSHVLWRKGKGAIGMAWAEDDPLVANVEHLQQRATSEQLFYEIPRRDRFGLEWREFRRARHYRSILAVPLRVNGRVRGCLSVDIQVDGRADDLDNLSQNDQFNNVVAVCEAVLGGKR